MYANQSEAITEVVFYTGTDAILQGEGVCRDFTFGTLTVADGRRTKRVSRPSSSNNEQFAGVLTQSYPADANGHEIVIAKPGSYVSIALGADSTAGTTRLTCSAGGGDAGRFSREGMPGRGTAHILQTVTALVASDLTGGAVITHATKNMADTGAFANVQVGDTVVLLEGGLASTGDKKVTSGRYEVSAVTDDDNIVLAGTPTTADADKVSYYIISANPMALAFLEVGDESGLQEWLAVYDSIAASMLPTGFTHIGGTGLTFGADATATLADGTRLGQRKRLKAYGTITTQDFKLTVTSGEQRTMLDVILDAGTADGSPLALASAEFDGANDELILVWNGLKWVELGSTGVTLNAS